MSERTFLIAVGDEVLELFGALLRSILDHSQHLLVADFVLAQVDADQLFECSKRLRDLCDRVVVEVKHLGQQERGK